MWLTCHPRVLYPSHPGRAATWSRGAAGSLHLLPSAASWLYHHNQALTSPLRPQPLFPVFGWEEALTTGEDPDLPVCRGGWSSPWLLLSPDILPVLTSYQPLGPRCPPPSVSRIRDRNEGDLQPLELPRSYPDALRPSQGGGGFAWLPF